MDRILDAHQLTSINNPKMLNRYLGWEDKQQMLDFYKISPNPYSPLDTAIYNGNYSAIIKKCALDPKLCHRAENTDLCPKLIRNQFRLCQLICPYLSLKVH